MSNIIDQILDAAERRIRVGGYGGFSFREIATDVGIRSSSVHYYFSTKEKLGAAIIRRYTDEVARQIDVEIAAGAEATTALSHMFRRTVVSEGRMCPSTIFGAEARSLPPEVAAEVSAFFKMCLAKLTAQGVSQDEAMEHVSALIGALVMANAMNDRHVYDRAILRRLAERSGRVA